MHIGVPWELGRSRSLHMRYGYRAGDPDSKSPGSVVHPSSWSAKKQAGRMWYRQARETEANGKGEGSLSVLIVPVESRVTGPDGSL
jgi:hypothetical protein